jgi:predicted nucleic acid-binding protein
MEVGNALARGFKPQAVRIIEHLMAQDNVEVVHVTRDLFGRGFGLYRDYQDKQWGLVDCISFAVMRERGMTDALTFDQHFTQAGFNALMRAEG